MSKHAQTRRKRYKLKQAESLVPPELQKVEEALQRLYDAAIMPLPFNPIVKSLDRIEEVVALYSRCAKWVTQVADAYGWTPDSESKEAVLQWNEGSVMHAFFHDFLSDDSPSPVELLGFPPEELLDTQRGMPRKGENVWWCRSSHRGLPPMDWTKDSEDGLREILRRSLVMDHVRPLNDESSQDRMESFNKMTIDELESLEVSHHTIWGMNSPTVSVMRARSFAMRLIRWTKTAIDDYASAVLPFIEIGRTKSRNGEVVVMQAGITRRYELPRAQHEFLKRLAEQSEATVRRDVKSRLLTSIPEINPPGMKLIEDAEWPEGKDKPHDEARYCLNPLVRGRIYTKNNDDGSRQTS